MPTEHDLRSKLMWLSLLVVVLVLAIAYFQAAQGLFSALLMVVLTICCATVAIGTYEWAAVNWLVSFWRPDFAHSIALGVIFGLPLLVLRLGLDRLVRRSALIPLWADRIGGGLCGLVTGMTLVGVMAICVLMIPFGPLVMGFSRVNVVVSDKEGSTADSTPLDPQAAEKELMLSPDRFAIAAASMLSDGIFSGPRSLRGDNPDFVQASAWVNSVPSEVTRYAPPGSISVVKTAPLPFVYRVIPPARQARRGEVQEPTTYERLPPKPGHEFRMVSVEFEDAARDHNRSHLFSLRQFRLVGQPFDTESYQQYHAIAIEQEKDKDQTDTLNRHIRYHRKGTVDWPVIDTIYKAQAKKTGDDNRTNWTRSGAVVVEVVFEVPTGFQPAYVQYKRCARADVLVDEAENPGVDSESQSSAARDPDDAITESRSGEGAVGRPNRGGNIRRFTTRQGQSFFGDELPWTLQSYRRLKNAEITRGAIRGGHLVGFADEQEAGRDAPVRRFHVPGDKRLLQLNSEFLKAKSGFGKAISFAVGTLQNYFVEDSRGRRHVLVGKYAVADVGGRQVIEVQYFSNKVGTVGQLGKFDKIQDSNLKGDYDYVLLFLVDPGARLTAFSTGGATSRMDDLTGENLVAPQ